MLLINIYWAPSGFTSITQVHNIKEKTELVLQNNAWKSHDKDLEVLRVSVLLVLNINTVCMPRKLICVSDVCFFYFETMGVKAGMMISDSWEKIPRPGRARGK